MVVNRIPFFEGKVQSIRRLITPHQEREIAAHTIDHAENTFADQIEDSEMG
jgi:hypothetical protein